MKIKTLKLSKITIGGCYLEGLLCVKKKEPADFQQVLQISCGERGTRDRINILSNSLIINSIES